MQTRNTSNGIWGVFKTVRGMSRLTQTQKDGKGSLEEDGMAMSKIPVRAWIIVIEPKQPNIIVFFPLNAYILTLR